MPRMNGFGNRTAARSRSADSLRNARTSACELLKLAKALARGGAAHGSIIRGAFILKRVFTGGSIILTNQRPTNPGAAGPRLNFFFSRARSAGSFIAPRYTRVVAV